MEKRTGMHVNLLRRDEFRETECVGDVFKYVLPSVPASVTADPHICRILAQSDLISETYFAGFDLDLGGGNWGTRRRLTATSIFLRRDSVRIKVFFCS